MNEDTCGRRSLRERSRPWRAGWLAAAAAGIALLAAACGGSGGSATPARSSHPAGYQQFYAYSQCMRSHGALFWPEPSAIQAGVFDNPNTYKITARVLAQEHGPGWQAALTACHKLAPPQLPFTAAQIRALRSQLLKLAACMRARGITHFPSPVVGPSGGGFPSPGPGVHPGSAQFQAAQQACRAYMPGS